MRPRARRQPSRSRPPHPDALLVALALLAVALLHVVKVAAAPPLVAAADAPAHEGARVAIEARVVDVRHGERGRYLVLADDTARLPVLGPPGEGPARGDVVRAVGVVSRLDDGPGLSLESLDVLVPAATRPVMPADLARAPELHEGARVLVRGEWRDGALVGGGARVTLTGLAPPGDVKEGLWLVAGTFYYREASAAYVLSVDAWTRP